MARKALLKSNQASSKDVMRSISFQDTRARSIRKAYSLKCFRERLTVMRGGRLTPDPLCMQPMRQLLLRSWLKTAEVYLEGKMIRMISKRVAMVTDLGLYLVGSLIICVRLRASRTAGVLSLNQLRSPNTTHSQDSWGHSIPIWCPVHRWGLKGGYNKRQQ